MTWIRPLQALQHASTLTIFAPNGFVRDRLYERYLSRVREMASEVGLSVAVQIGTRASEAPLRRARSLVPAPAPELNDRFTFEGLVEGACNRVALAVARQVVANPGVLYNPLFLYGETGTGKTHLMQAVGHALRAQRPDARIRFVRAESFMQEMVAAINANTMLAFTERYRQQDLLLVDDVQFFAGKGKTQEVFLHLFNALVDQHHQVIMTCDRYPKEVPGLQEQLCSRLSGGMVVEVGVPDAETRKAILLHKAARLGVALPEEVARLVSGRLQSNVRELEGLLLRLATTARIAASPITVGLTKQALADVFGAQARQLTLPVIQKVVAEHFGLRIADLTGKRRTRSVTVPRQLAMALAKEITSFSLSEIGNAFGGRDHSTVLYAHKKIQAERGRDEQLENDYRTLLRQLQRG
jgi:chromosomal replication initiator protein